MINLTPIMSGDDLKATAFAIEIVTFLTGEVREDELEWDVDPLREWYIDQVVDEQDKVAYREERRLAEDEARESILNQLQSQFRERSKVLHDAYPFEMDRDTGVFLRRIGEFEFTTQSACYLWLALFRASQAQLECLTLTKEQQKVIHSLFKNTFEIVVAFAALGNHDGYCWHLGGSRDAIKLNRRLNYVTRRVGSGVVKRPADLDINQENDNDGGVDIVHYKEPSEPMIHLIGATIQKSNRKSKIMADAEKRRFRRLFQNEIAIPHQGVLAVPFDHSEVENLNCAEADCHYYHGDVIIEYLGKLSEVSDRKTRHLSQQLSDATKKLVEALGIELCLPASEAVKS